MRVGQLWTDFDLRGGGIHRADPPWQFLAGFYCTCTSSCITLKLPHMWSPMISLDWWPGKWGPIMAIYCNAIIMKQGSCSIFCTGAFMIQHGSALFQKAGTTGLRTGSLSCIDVLYLSPGAPLSFLLLTISCLRAIIWWPWDLAEEGAFSFSDPESRQFATWIKKVGGL